MRQTHNAPPGAALPRRHGDKSYRPIAAGLKFGVEHIDVIEQSHERCAALGVSRIERPDLALLGRADLTLARERNRRLHEQAAPVMEMLYGQIINTHNMVVLTDATGTVLHSIGDDDFLERADKVALKPGANWSETAKGTNAVGTALVQETPTLVHADEHYLHANHFLTCSAAPILDPRGNMLGVLDVSGDHRSYHQHTMALVKMSARMIENRWLSDDHRHALRLHFHSRPEFIGTLMEGILALNAEGKIVGGNRSAMEQLGTSGAALRMHTLTTLLGSTVGALADRFRSPLALSVPLPLTLGDGRQVHVLARFNGHGMAGSSPQADNAKRAMAVPASTEDTALDALRTGSAVLNDVIDKARRTLDADVPLLLCGETGTGKQALARAMHAVSARSGLPFVLLHGADASVTQWDAALFGAVGDTAEHGRCGMLFIDDIGGLPAPVQLHLLRLLQDREALPAPQRRGKGLDFNIVCTTRQTLRELVATQALREDLFYRLNGMALRLPPLRERQDVAVLAQRFLAQNTGHPAQQLSPDVLHMLEQHPWPGNVRQLFNALRAACLLAGPAGLIAREHLPHDLLEDAAAHAATTHAHTPAQTLGDVELVTIQRAVQAAAGNISLASKRLGISRNTIYRRLNGSGVPR